MERQTDQIGLIGAEVTAYNELHGLCFDGIHACASYINTPTYTHYPFCKAVWEWNVDVWETARLIQLAVLDGSREIPTDEEFLNELPTFNFS